MLMEHSELSESRDLDLEVIGLASAEVCILLTGNCTAAVELARRIHGMGRGRPGRFKVVNCGWPESLLEEQLFHAIRPGSSGTLFLEEVGRLTPALQDRLLDTLDGSIDPRGPRPPRARLMACTSEPLVQRALEGSFNEKLLYRLNAIHLVVPPGQGDW
jgi:DNA-binding NtrC family response regulator